MHLRCNRRLRGAHSRRHNGRWRRRPEGDRGGKVRRQSVGSNWRQRQRSASGIVSSQWHSTHDVWRDTIIIPVHMLYVELGSNHRWCRLLHSHTLYIVFDSLPLPRDCLPRSNWVWRDRSNITVSLIHTPSPECCLFYRRVNGCAQF